jgi:DNA-binding MarR family transcriptional regulator
MSKQSDTPFKFRGFQGPNYTMVPDELFDELMVELSGGELKVLMYIIRRTFGFKRDSDSISLSQMLNGITTRDGRTLDRGVGISKPTLLQALRSLEEKNVIQTERQRSAERGDEPTVYRLKFADGVLQQEILPPVVKKVIQGGGQESLPEGGQGTSPGPWTRKLTTQETVKQETDLNLSNIRRASPIEKREDGETTRPTSRADASIPARPVRFTRQSRSDEPTPLHGRENASFEGVGPVVGRSRPQPASPHDPPDEARQVILEYVEDFAREFNDQAPLKSSTTRAYNLYQQSGLSIGDFIAQMHHARSLTKESTAQIRSQTNGEGRGAPTKRKMAYFFACLEDQLGLRDEEDGLAQRGY